MVEGNGNVVSSLLLRLQSARHETLNKWGNRFLQPQYTSYPINSSGETCPTATISMLTHTPNVICIPLSVVTHFLIYTEVLNTEFQWCTVFCQIFDFGS